MATVKEMMLDMMDAAANVDTAAMMSAGDTFEGTIDNDAGDTEDWIGIEMEAGTTYTITVTGTLAGADGGAMDTILSLVSSKGDAFMTNDDDPDMDGVSPGSKLEFTPEVSDTYYISVSTYRSNPELDNSGTYTVEVTGMVVDPTMGMAINGTERVMAEAGPPAVLYQSGNDKLTGTAVDETINGLSGDDTLNGMGGDDVLNGGDHNDLLVGGAGADELNGGDGDDTIDYSYSPMAVTINLNDGTARGGDAEGDTLGNDIEHVRGSMHDDALTGARVGTARHNKIWGLGGNDELDGLRGRDELFGGAGDDDLDGGDDDDMLEGGYGADMLTGGDHGDNGDTASYSMSMMGVTVRLHSGQAMGGDAEGDVFAGSGTPVEYTDSDEDMAEMNVFDIENLTGSANDDILAGDLRNNTIKGGGGDDKIYGGPNPADADKESDAGLSNADTLMGQGGDDMIFGGVGDDTLDGGDGDDTLNGGTGADTFMGGADDDMIHADATDIYNVATDGTRTLKTTNVINGGEDNDTVSFAKLEDGIGAEGAAFTLGRQDSELETGTALLVDGIENVIGTQGDDHITGNAGDNVIEGGEGGDFLDGGGPDPAAVAASNGMMIGDTLSYAGSDDWVRVTLNAAGSAATTSRGHASGDQATNFENVRGSAYDDDLTGNGDANRLWGGAGDDKIEGGEGNDTLEGGAGADDLDGGYSNGGTPGAPNTEVNTVSYAGSDADVTINLATASASGGHATGDTIVTYEESAPTTDDPGNEIDVARFANVTGSMHDDHLTGNHHDNQLEGGAGDDTLRGGASNAGDRNSALAIRGDVLVGGPGADLLDGGEDMNEKDDMVPDPDNAGQMLAASVDWVVYKHAEEGITVDMSTSVHRGTGGEAMGDTLHNIELVWGSEKDDTFIAGPGGDIIEGDGGSDTVSYEASEMGVTVSLVSDNRTVDVTGDGSDATPFVFGPDADPAAATTHLTATGVPKLNAAGNPFDTTTNVENEDTNPNVNGAAGDKLGSIENLTGSAMKDVLTGDTNPNVLKGMGGNDTLTGGAETNGGDTLDGGDGDDILNGEGGADKLMGGAGDDTLNGGAGEDTLTGGSGNDDLTGGADADTFVFSMADAGDSDAILDFGDGGTAGDKIDLSAFELTAEQVIAATTLRGTGTDAYAVINLEAHGGGRITLQDVDSLDDLDSATGASADGSIQDQANDGAIQTLDTDIFILG